MSKVQTEDMKDLLGVIPIMPISLMTTYLKRRYGLTDHSAAEAIYAATRHTPSSKPIIYACREGLSRTENMSMDSESLRLCRAFRVAVEFLPEGRDFVNCRAYRPWLINFHSNLLAYYVCEFNARDAIITADTIRSMGIRKELAESTRRIAILNPGVDKKLLDGCGIKYFCTVDNNYNLTVTDSVPDEELWHGTTSHA